MPYFPQGHKDFNELRHLILLYGDPAKPWTRGDLRYYVAHLDQKGEPDDWLFDSFLFLNVKAGTGRDYSADINIGSTMAGEGNFVAVCSPQPANKGDWEALVEFYLGEHGALRNLDAAIGECADKIGRPYGARRNVVLMLPYPHITQGSFGALSEGGGILDFSTKRHNLAKATEERLAAERWLVDEYVQRFTARQFKHLNLLGVYWMFETIYRSWDVDDHWLLKELRKHIRARGLKFLWIPFWSSYNVHLLDDYQKYYFDLAFLQPNYMFYKQGKTIAAAAHAARQRNAGIEMEYYLELNEPIAVQSERHARFREYLNGGVTYGYMSDAVCAHFQGARALQRMHMHTDAREREFYEDICQFVTGTYRLKSEIEERGAEGIGRVALSVDLGGTNLRGALIDAEGTIHHRVSERTPSSKEEILRRLKSTLRGLVDEARRRGAHVHGIGVSTGGRVDFDAGVILDSTALLSDWQNIPLREILQLEFQLPVSVDNDGNCAALAELMLGEGRAASHFITLVLGTGIGGGVVVDGKLLRGARNAAAELGHISISHDGPECSCGNKGCVELYASGSALARQAKELVKSGAIRLDRNSDQDVSAEALADAARKGNAAAQQLIEQAGTSLGIAVAGLLNTFNPERIILSGSLIKLGDMYMRPFRETVKERSMAVARETAVIVVSDLSDPGLLGAASLVFSRGAVTSGSS